MEYYFIRPYAGSFHWRFMQFDDQFPYIPKILAFISIKHGCCKGLESCTNAQTLLFSVVFFNRTMDNEPREWLMSHGPGESWVAMFICYGGSLLVNQNHDTMILWHHSQNLAFIATFNLNHKTKRKNEVAMFMFYL